MNSELCNFLHGLSVDECYEAESPGVLGGGVPHHHRLGHRAELAEVFLHGLLCGLPGEAANKHFTERKIIATEKKEKYFPIITKIRRGDCCYLN